MSGSVNLPRPDRIREFYSVKSHRIEPVGLVYESLILPLLTSQGIGVDCQVRLFFRKKFEHLLP